MPFLLSFFGSDGEFSLIWELKVQHLILLFKGDLAFAQSLADHGKIVNGRINIFDAAMFKMVLAFFLTHESNLVISRGVKHLIKG